MAKRIQQKPRKQRSLRGMARRGLSILMAMVMVISLIQISVFADVNDTEFHIMTLADIKNVVSAKNGDDASDIEICTLKVHGQDSSANGGAATKYWVIGDVGYPGINGKDSYNGTDYWKVLNTCDIVDVSKGITGLTIYYRAAGAEKECYVPGSELRVEQLTGLSGLITEIYFKNSGETPEEKSYPVYVYVEPKDGQGTINGHNYMTIGEISMPIMDPAQANIDNNYYEEYKQAISTALDSIQRFEANDWLDLKDVDWTGLYVRYGADDYESDSSQLVWHLDGKIKDKVTLFHVYYDANGGQGEVPEDTNQYAAGQPFAAMSGAGLSKENCAFLGWSVNPAATQPDQSFAIPKEGKDITLYADWKDQTAPDPDPVTEMTNFYISLDGTVRDYVDENGNAVVSGHDTSYFSGSVYTGEMAATSHDYTLVGKTNEAASTDAAIRALAPDTLKSIPSDDSVFAALRQDTKMQAYCTTNGVDINSITGENYNIYWYVVKCEDDGWHVDGVLVAKGQEPSYPVDYTVIHEYYTDGTKTSEVSQTLSGHVGDKITAADLEKKLTDAQGNTYTYTSASADLITLTDNAAANKITLRYDRTTGGGNPGGTTYYTLTVKYLEEGTDEQLAAPYISSIAAGRSYDATAQTQKAIDGYSISKVEGTVTGYMNGNVEIIVYYTTEIGDGETPLDPGPGTGGSGSGNGDTNIGDIEVPLDPGTGIGTGGDGTDIGDENVPLVPATGDSLALWVLAAVASAAGLVYLTVTGKKREQENG